MKNAANESMEAAPRQASFRHRVTGCVVETGPFHDITRLPDGEADLESWEAGFTDGYGRFYDRCEAARLVGLDGRLEAESFFAGEDQPTLEAGNLESWHKGSARRAA